MAYIQHPVVGDPLYGRRKLKDDLGLERQFLHSWTIGFDHPLTNERIEVAEPLPADLATALASISDRSDGKTPRGLEVEAALTAAGPQSAE
jgi:23S rRNA pseudouridine1911/1915/1917 synthase